MNIFKRPRWLAAAVTVMAGSAALAAVVTTGASAAPSAAARLARATGLGQTTGLLPRDHLTLENAIQVDLSNETVRLPIYKGIAYKGTAKQETVWYVLMDASDAGLAHDLGVNYAPKLANLAINDPAAVQTVTLESPTPQQNRFGQAVVDFAGAPDFSPTRIAEPGPGGFPLAKFQPGAVAGPGTARSSGSPARTWSTARRSSPPVTARSTSSTTPTPGTGSSACISRRPRRPASTPNRGPTCCSSRASTPASRSSTSAPTPASR
jgi:hypothetical protein